MVTTLRAIEVRTATAAEVPKVAAALADAFIDDRCSRSFGRAVCGSGRGYERCLWLRSSSTCWRTVGPCGRPLGTTARWPSCHPAHGRCRSRRRGKRRSTGCGRSGRDCRARSESSVRWRSGTCVSLTSTSERSGATALQGQGVGSMLMQPTLERADSARVPTYIEASSERSAALYERLGFLHMGVFELPDGGPPVWPMRRPSGRDPGRP